MEHADGDDDGEGNGLIPEFPYSFPVPPPLILASASPRRRDLLAGAGVSFAVAAADINESWQEGETPMAHCLRLARSKALIVAEKNPGALALGADTIVVLDV